MSAVAFGPGQAAILLFGVFFTLFLLRVPVAFALGLACRSCSWKSDCRR